MEHTNLDQPTFQPAVLENYLALMNEAPEELGANFARSVPDEAIAAHIEKAADTTLKMAASLNRGYADGVPCSLEEILRSPS